MWRLYYCQKGREEERKLSQDTNTTWVGEERLERRSRRKIKTVSKEAEHGKIVGGEWCQSSGQTEKVKSGVMVVRFD